MSSEKPLRTTLNIIGVFLYHTFSKRPTRKKLVPQANHIWVRQDGGGSVLLYRKTLSVWWSTGPYSRCLATNELPSAASTLVLSPTPLVSVVQPVLFYLVPPTCSRRGRRRERIHGEWNSSRDWMESHRFWGCM